MRAHVAIVIWKNIHLRSKDACVFVGVVDINDREGLPNTSPVVRIRNMRRVWPPGEDHGIPIQELLCRIDDKLYFEDMKF